MKDLLKNVGLIFVAALLVLAMAEATTRAFHEPRTKGITTFRLSGSSFYRQDDRLGWVPKKNVQGRHDRAESFKSSFSTNAYGLRDTNHSLLKAEGTRRIVVLGDSFAWGFGVNDGEIFTDYLESALNDVEVINLGVTAYGLRQEIAYFERLGIQFDPDVVLLTFVLNDIYSARDADTAARQKTRHETPHVPNEDSNGGLFRTVKQTLARNSALYTLLQDATSQYKILVDFMVWVGLKEPPFGFAGLDSNLMPALREYPAALKKGWRNARAQLLQLKAICEHVGSRLIVAVVPSRQTIDKRAFQQTIAYTAFYDDDFDLDKPYRMLEAFGGEHGIETIIPVAAFRDAANAGAGLYLPRDMHFSKEGHRLFAEQIRNYLLNAPQGNE